MFLIGKKKAGICVERVVLLHIRAGAATVPAQFEFRLFRYRATNPMSPLSHSHKTMCFLSISTSFQYCCRNDVDGAFPSNGNRNGVRVGNEGDITVLDLVRQHARTQTQTQTQEDWLNNCV